MITEVVESKHDGRPFWRIRSFFSFLHVCFSYKHRVLIGLKLLDNGDYDLNVLYYGLTRAGSLDIVNQLIEFERQSSTNLESIDKRVILPD